MKTIWLALLERAIAGLLSYRWDDVRHQVSLLMDEDLSGTEKRQRAFDFLRKIGVDSATWILYAGIEIAYGRMKEGK